LRICEIIPVALALLFGFLPACNQENNGRDGGNPDADGIDGGGDDDPGEPFLLIFDPGAQACSQFMIQRTAAQELALRGRIVFRPGTITLPRDADSFSAELIDEVHLTGPEPVQAQPDGPGEITHEYRQQVWGYRHLYTYTQAFHAGSRPFGIEATFSFRFRDGVSDPDELTFDPDRVGEEPQGYNTDYTQVSILGFLDNGEDYLKEKQTYRSCTFSSLPSYRVTAGLEGGDTIVLFKRYLKPNMGTGPAAVTQAEIDLDGRRRTVENYFQTAYAADLHNFNERYLVVLDPPIGDIHGVHFEETNQNDPPTVVDLLDADLAPSGQRTVTGYVDEEAP
jgi:hypothetical protein